MKLPFTVSVLLCVFVVIVSSASLSPKMNKNVDEDINKWDKKPRSHRTVSATSRSRFSIVTRKMGVLPSVARNWRLRCTSHGGVCASYVPPCCGSLRCISFKCTSSRPSCVNLNSRCGWRGTKCCGTLHCIHGVCKLPPPPTPSPSPRPACSSALCGHGHPPCCRTLSCHSGVCINFNGPFEIPELQIP